MIEHDIVHIIACNHALKKYEPTGTLFNACIINFKKFWHKESHEKQQSILFAFEKDFQQACDHIGRKKTLLLHEVASIAFFIKPPAIKQLSNNLMCDQYDKYILSCYGKEIHENYMKILDILKNHFGYDVCYLHNTGELIKWFQEQKIKLPKPFLKTAKKYCNITNIQKEFDTVKKENQDLKLQLDAFKEENVQLKKKKAPLQKRIKQLLKMFAALVQAKYQNKLSLVSNLQSDLHLGGCEKIDDKTIRSYIKMGNEILEKQSQK